MIQIWC